MNDKRVKECPFCREEILADAVKCRYCKSELPFESTSDCESSVGDIFRERGHRDLPGRMIAGSAAYLARTTGVSVTMVRLAFVAGGFFAFPAAVAVYGAVWAVVPFKPAGKSAMDRVVDELRGMYQRYKEKPAARQEETSEEKEAAIYPALQETNGHS